MGPQEIIAAYDAAPGLTDFTLRRIVGESNQQNIDVVCRGKINPGGMRELSGGIIQRFDTVVMTMTQIWAAQWPGGVPSNSQPGTDPQVPREGDVVQEQGRQREIVHVKTWPIDGVVTRIELEVLG